MLESVGQLSDDPLVSWTPALTPRSETRSLFEVNLILICSLFDSEMFALKSSGSCDLGG